MASTKAGENKKRKKGKKEKKKIRARRKWKGMERKELCIGCKGPRRKTRTSGHRTLQVRKNKTQTKS